MTIKNFNIMNNTNQTLFECLPEELSYIIFTYLEVDNSLKDLDHKLLQIYNKYVNNVKLGYENPFELMSLDKLKVFYYLFTGRDSETKDAELIINIYDTTGSASIYYIVELKDEILKIHDIDKMIYISHTIYDIIGICGEDVYVFIYTSKMLKNGKTMYVLYHENDGDVEAEKLIIRSNNWKDIWDKLSVVDKNNILKHNKFPMIL